LTLHVWSSHFVVHLCSFYVYVRLCAFYVLPLGLGVINDDDDNDDDDSFKPAALHYGVKR